MSRATYIASASRSHLFFILIISFIVFAPQLHASSPTITFTSNPVNYGQIDKITATTQALYPAITLYINKDEVASVSKSTVNYTICNVNPCLIPGTYAITAYNNLTGATTTDNLVVAPTYPTFSVQSSTVPYGNTDKITAYSAFYNDTVSIMINGSSVASGTGSITYVVCGNISGGEPCLSVGSHAVSVKDTTEGAWATSNRIINVTKSSVPTLSIQSSSVVYGAQDTIKATSTLKTDSVAIFLNSASVASGTGSASYTICNPSPQNCISPGNYSVYVSDSSQSTNSVVKTILITPLSPSINIAAASQDYGTATKISAKSAKPNESISIYIDGASVATGTGNVSYTVCSPILGTPCLAAGNHIVSAYDGTEKAYSSNKTMTINPVLPSLSLSSGSVPTSTEVTVTAAAPYYNDKLSILINGSSVATGSGTVAYSICNPDAPSSCLSSGRYSISVSDTSENANSIQQILLVQSKSGATVSTSSVLQNTSSTQQKTTISASNAPVKPGATISNQDLNIIVTALMVVVVVVIILAILLRWRRSVVPPPPPVENS